MKIIIVTGKFGNGHSSVAQAIKEKINTQYENADVEIVDIIEYLIPGFAKTMYKCFNFVVGKTPIIYNKMVDFCDRKHTDIPFKKKYAIRINNSIEKSNPDIIISTLHFGSQYVSECKKKYGSKIPLYTVITDISARDEWISSETNMYFVPSIEVKKELIKKGVSSLKIEVIGIPVKEHFYKSGQFTIKNKKEILIMGGGLGLLPIEKKHLAKLDASDYVNTTIICGRNEKLKEKLENEYPNIKVLGFVYNVDEYMKNSDLLITKAGGVSMFEAIFSKIPMYVFNPFLKQEIENAKYIESKKIGEVCWNEKEFYDKLIGIISNDYLLNKMKNAMNYIAENIDTTRIIKVIERCCNGNSNRNFNSVVTANIRTYIND